MAYANMERNRAATLVAVGALHAAAGYALIVGLAGPVWQIVEEKPLVGHQIPLPAPSPDVTETPEANPIKEPQRTDSSMAHQVVTVTPIPLSNDNDKLVLPPFQEDFGIGTIEPPSPPPPPAEAFTPKLPSPIGKPGLWVTPNDYPAADLRAEHEGVTRFRLTIGADGRVQSCEITVSSGHASLDAAACVNLRKRARFAAATDGSGTAVTGTYSSAVRWTIPKD
jgi:protein TonB